MEEKKYTGRGGWRGGARPRTFRKLYSITMTDQVNAALDLIAAREGLKRAVVIEMLINQKMKEYEEELL